MLNHLTFPTQWETGRANKYSKRCDLKKRNNNLLNYSFGVASLVRFGSSPASLGACSQGFNSEPRPTTPGRRSLQNARARSYFTLQRLLRFNVSKLEFISLLHRSLLFPPRSLTRQKTPNALRHPGQNQLGSVLLLFLSLPAPKLSSANSSNLRPVLSSSAALTPIQVIFPTGLRALSITSNLCPACFFQNSHPKFQISFCYSPA